MSSRSSASDMSERQQCLDDLDDYINTCQTEVSEMLDTLGWSPDHFVQPRTRGTCPCNSSHRMSNESLVKHVPLCKIISQGCSKEDAEKVLEDSSFCYQNSTCVHTEPIDLEKLNAVLWNYHVKNNSVFYGYKKMPLIATQEEGMLSREDRLGMAEFIVKKAKEANRLKELGKDELLVSENLADLVRKDDEERQLDHVEELAALRDYRRRRQTYRAKNVHITKKSHTEILREVITNQMDMYAKSLQDDGLVDPQTDRSDDVRDNRIPNDRESRQTSDKTSIDYTELSGNSRDQHSRSRADRSDSRSIRRKRSVSRDRRSRSRDRRRSRSRDRKTDRSRRKDRKRRSRSQDRYSSPRLEERKTASNLLQGRESGSNDGTQDIPTRQEVVDSRSRDRSRSRSHERHKKHKHKKHKKKHKKHRGSDHEDCSSRQASFRQAAPSEDKNETDKVGATNQGNPIDPLSQIDPIHDANQIDIADETKQISYVHGANQTEIVEDTKQTDQTDSTSADLNIS